MSSRNRRTGTNAHRQTGRRTGSHHGHSRRDRKYWEQVHRIRRTIYGAAAILILVVIIAVSMSISHAKRSSNALKEATVYTADLAKETVSELNSISLDTEPTPEPTPTPDPTIDPANYDGKIVYLTFDDGPGPYTQQLLDTLAKYNVRATFFTTSHDPNWQALMQAEFAAGHTVAVHTYTHDYATIYASDTAYWEDFDMQRANVESVTGQPVHFFRFPGGASNTVSANYCSGIMTTLAQESVEKGLVYVDWNVSSGDASGDATKESVIDNILTQVEYYDQSVVLCHDTKDYTVEAIDTIIPQLQAQGYTFLPYSDKSELVQHGIAN